MELYFCSIPEPPQTPPFKATRLAQDLKGNGNRGDDLVFLIEPEKGGAQRIEPRCPDSSPGRPLLCSHTGLRLYTSREDGFLTMETPF